MTTTRRELAPRYDAALVEPAIYELWMESGAFTPAAEQPPGADRFVITQPPPNVTGALHLGHALTATVEDAFIRYHRMRGDDTLWLPGVDHASIAAQFVLDRIIAEEGETRASLGRERYLERMWRFMDETRDVIGEQHRRLGASLDWTRLRFTMDDGSARAVRVAFKRLWDAGLVYRGEALVNWCPGCRTTISDLENIHREETGTLWTVRYHLAREDGDAGPRCVDQRGHHPPGDDPRRHRGRGAPGRRSVPRHRRPRGDPPVPRSAPADRRGRVGRARVRHRRGEDHAGARLRRLRARAQARAADDLRPRRGGADERERRRVRRDGSVRRAEGRRRAPARDGRPGGRASAPDGRRPLRSSATPWSSRGSACSGSSARSRWRSARSHRSPRGGPGSCPRTSRRCTPTGWRTSTTGPSGGSCGGATASRRGSAPMATSPSRTRRAVRTRAPSAAARRPS